MPMVNHFFQSFRDTCKYNSDIQAAPLRFLWPGTGCKWKTVNPNLKKELPQLLVLGNYRPEKRTGPAICRYRRRQSPLKKADTIENICP